MIRPAQAELHMGTVVEATLATRLGEPAARDLLRAAFAAFTSLEACCSRFRATSDLSRVNRDAHRRAVSVSPLFLGLLEQALALAAASGGCFSPLLGPLVALWEKDRAPSPARVARARALCAPGLVELDPVRGSVRFHRRGVGLNLDGLAKGQATDRALLALRAEGVAAARVNAGGSSLAWFGGAGPAPGVALRHPAHARSVVGVLALPRAGALATTGAFPPHGRGAGHVVDPRSGRPHARRASATVVGARASLAEAAAKVFLLMDHEAAAAQCRRSGWSVKALVLDDERDGLRLVHDRGLRVAPPEAA